MNEQLEGCISRLQEMNDALQVCTQTLQTATQDFPRLRMVSALQRNYEFVTEKEMRAAKDQVADQVEPQMINLISKAEDILCALEKERDEIATKLNEPVHEEQATPSKRTPVAKPGAPKLIAIQRKKDALIRKATKLRKELQRKEREMNEAFEKSEQTDDKSMKDDDSTPETRQKNAGHYEELNEEYKLLAKALSNRQAALEAERALKAKQAEEAKAASAVQPAINWTHKLKVYQQQLLWLNQNINNGEVLPGNEVMELKKTLDTELQEMRSIESVAAKEKHALAIRQCKALVKLFYPQRSIGNTMGRLLELLLETSNRQVTMRALEEEFPPARESRHGLKQAISWLKELGLVATRKVTEAYDDILAGDELLYIEFTSGSASLV